MGAEPIDDMTERLSDTSHDHGLERDEACKLYAEYVQAVSRAFEARRSRPRVNDRLLARLCERRDELERSLEHRR